MSMSVPRPAAIALALSAAATAALAQPKTPGRGAFEGIWSVNIITEAGECDKGYRYRIRIAGGAVQYAGDSDFTVSGRVTPAGAVRVTVARGQQSATGIGRLVGDRGAGTWRGASAIGACSGRWEAERRG